MTESRLKNLGQRPDERDPRRFVDRAYSSFIFKRQSPVGYRIQLIGSASEGRQRTLTGQRQLRRAIDQATDAIVAAG